MTACKKSRWASFLQWCMQNSAGIVDFSPSHACMVEVSQIHNHPAPPTTLRTRSILNNLTTPSSPSRRKCACIGGALRIAAAPAEALLAPKPGPPGTTSHPHSCHRRNNVPPPPRQALHPRIAGGLAPASRWRPRDMRHPCTAGALHDAPPELHANRDGRRQGG